MGEIPCVGEILCVGKFLCEGETPYEEAVSAPMGTDAMYW